MYLLALTRRSLGYGGHHAEGQLLSIQRIPLDELRLERRAVPAQWMLWFVAYES